MSKIVLKHDATIEIATGRNRKDTSWKNKEMLWSDFVNRASTTQRTSETQAEYFAFKKPQQDEKKDVGGYVGGYLTGGRRKAGNVLNRAIVTLDIDYSDLKFWCGFTIAFDCAALIYSTHKHTAKEPRYRLVILLNRVVRREEYEAIARRIAGTLNIEAFDPTTFQPERLMYWPSTSKDGQFVFEYQDGPALNADAILDSYTDWQDSSSWPVSSKIDKILQRSIAKQGDPLEKPGVIGAFCRTYSIHEVIEAHLSDIYEATNVENRYTYKEGSTAAGLIVYDDKFAYSHHGTDPISGKLCNAFDLVRIHKYGLKDEEVKDGTPVNKLPSFAAMEAFVSTDIKAKRTLINEKDKSAKDDFAGILEAESIDDTWKDELDVDRKGNIYSTINNCLLILANDQALKECFTTDDFLKRKVIRKDLPWRTITPESKYLKDEDELNLLNHFEKAYGITSRINIKTAFDIHIDANRFHPVKTYLESLQWDGKPRLENLFIDYMGAAESEFTKAVTRKSLVACVARIFNPGCKFDYVPTFIGPEGMGKSSLIAKLGGQWFSDTFSFNMLHSKEAYEQIQGVWLVEIAELTGLKKADVEGAKQFLSKQEDSFRPAYGRNVVTYKRQCVFFGSTNNREFLISQTGNRRFWPIDTLSQAATKNVFKDLTETEVNQVWAEAVTIYRAGEDLFLSKELEATAKLIQSEHSEFDARTGIIQHYLDTLLPENWNDLDTYERRAFLKGDALQPKGTIQRTRVCAAEILCEALGGMDKDINRQNTKEAHAIMRQIEGWGEHKAKVSFGKYGQQKGYYRIKKSENSVGVPGKKTLTSEQI